MLGIVIISSECSIVSFSTLYWCEFTSAPFHCSFYVNDMEMWNIPSTDNFSELTLRIYKITFQRPVLQCFLNKKKKLPSLSRWHKLLEEQSPVFLLYKQTRGVMSQTINVRHISRFSWSTTASVMSFNICMIRPLILSVWHKKKYIVSKIYADY